MKKLRYQKTVLVAWSGGLDSTYLIHHYLELGYKVDVFNCFFHNASINQMKREKKAIEKMMNGYFKDKPVNLLGSSNIHFKGFAFKGLHLAQVPTWLYNALSFVQDHHHEVAIGYVMNDDACSFVKDFKKIWKSYKPLYWCDLPKLVFPLLKKKKSFLYNQLPEGLKKSVTWCESFNSIDNCGECNSCERMKYIVGDDFFKPKSRNLILAEEIVNIKDPLKNEHM